MPEKIVAEIDAEIARLQAAKRLLTPPSVPKKRGSGQQAITESPVAPKRARSAAR